VNFLAHLWLAEQTKTSLGDEALPEFCLRASTEIEQTAPWFVHAGGRVIEAQGFSRLLVSYAGAVSINHAIHHTANRMARSAATAGCGGAVASGGGRISRDLAGVAR
jgi:acyl carrier protein phosphodiesterase